LRRKEMRRNARPVQEEKNEEVNPKMEGKKKFSIKSIDEILH
jgi:hypothetical protein